MNPYDAAAFGAVSKPDPPDAMAALRDEVEARRYGVPALCPSCGAYWRPCCDALPQALAGDEALRVDE